MKQKIEKALTVLLMIYAGSAVAEGKVNDLCHIGNRVDKLEIINYPQGYTSPVSIDEGRLNEIYKYKVEITELDDKESKKIVELLQMDYAEQEENVTNLRWRVNITSYQNKNVISILMVLVYVEKLTVRMSASGIMK
ncbi:hypothetical protein RCN06_05405 [Escherichia marmotae]|uniref:hypothetical protein n=1 Tax=Escherichia TaxID=561 RepID=UPI001EE0ED10|nr:hypothetical protein [Escherichia sp. MOD1-EC5427]MEC9532067.1 hypothetical protein [Escherichia marmotae]MEC9848920.1 hypothetical protein [Escherichia marmotae]MEC9928252.1 hypothetical protein [Escherichia marmotae]MEC9978285.1 hypothetical protein [Escherichia marmotae]MED0429901.1 hypothetical protein [Escherichia marmotae]